MTHVLIVILITGYGPRPILTMQEFSSLARCEVAAASIREATTKYVELAKCVEK
jgi:hypothetical protein